MAKRRRAQQLSPKEAKKGKTVEFEKEEQMEEPGSGAGSDSGSESESSGSELEVEDDEVELEDDDVELNDDDEEQSSEQDDEEEGDESGRPVRQNRQQKEKESFSKAMSAILGSHLKSYDRQDPILVRSKKKAKEIEESKLEMKARRALNQDKRKLEDKDRVRDLTKTEGEGAVQKSLEYEKYLKQTARKGVVRLFNAVLASQAKSAPASKEVGVTKKEEKMNEMSKENFLDLVRSG
uniref:ARAD1D29722p n=1 Tax=Blastobotrys adeninivorans TaxID=409370 RepID=A0A060TAX2_BLAAD